ncbi:MAG: hypothetical protein AAF829_11820 [Pseudomonadota bacterium]
MDTGSPILRWREIVHPFFWPVFFWNLRNFAATLARKIEENNGQGLVSFDITWWGGIRIHLMIDPDPPKWDAGLERCAKCVHIATLDVFNPHLSLYSLTPQMAGIHLSASHPIVSFASSVRSSVVREGFAAISAGTFPQPLHFNTS